MTDKDIMPFHQWAKDARERSTALAANCEVTVIHSTNLDPQLQNLFEGVHQLASDFAVLLNVMATEAASRFEADVKGRADDQRARPPTIPENVPHMFWFVFQCMPGDKNKAPYRVFGMGRDPEDAEDQIYKTEGDEFFLVGWH